MPIAVLLIVQYRVVIDVQYAGRGADALNKAQQKARPLKKTDRLLFAPKKTPIRRLNRFIKRVFEF
jgi:hypothetical protein